MVCLCGSGEWRRIRRRRYASAVEKGSGKETVIQNSRGETVYMYSVFVKTMHDFPSMAGIP